MTLGAGAERIDALVWIEQRQHRGRLLKGFLTSAAADELLA
jgi:hypothetical protein